ncbi:Ubiquitin carboxyl-terminal hydrolase 25 [Linum grandiflorum]
MGCLQLQQMSWQPSLLSQQRKNRPPLGLKNLGNSCYLNSVLQCLTYTPPLANFCLRLQHSSICDSVSNGERKRECPFCIIEKRIIRSLSLEATIDTPLKINSCLRIFAEHFRRGRQEDAHEFLRYVIDACHNTCLRLKKLRRKGIGPASNTTVVSDIFGGALQSQVKCLSCNAESNKVDEIMDISLDILHSSSLLEAMHKFFQQETLDGNNKYQCESCKKLVAARKQMSIVQAPDVLVIQLKVCIIVYFEDMFLISLVTVQVVLLFCSFWGRETYTWMCGCQRFEGIFGGKIDKTVAFGEVLVLSSFMCKSSQDPQPEYSLFGTIVHSGYSPESGHYYAYIKDAMGRWYCCNDSYVTLSNLQEVLSEKVYILFFTRTNQKPVSKKPAVASNGVHSSDLNGSEASKITKATLPPKLGYPRPLGSGKDILASSDVDKITPRTHIKFNISGNSVSKMLPPITNGRADAAKVNSEANGTSEGKVHSERLGEPSMSSVIKHGACSSRNVNVANDETHHAHTAADENHHSENGVVTPLRPTSYKGNNGSLSNEIARTAPVCNEMPNGASNSRQLVSGSKRKLKQGSCVLFALDDESRAKVDELKDLLAQESSAFLRSSGWTGEVYNHMSKKRLRVQEAGSTRSAHDLKGLLIADAKRTFKSKVPGSLIGDLVKQLQSFSEGR